MFDILNPCCQTGPTIQQHHRKWSGIRPEWRLDGSSPRWHLPLVDEYIVDPRIWRDIIQRLLSSERGVAAVLPNCRVKSLTFNLGIITHRCAPCLTSAGGLHHRELNSSHRQLWEFDNKNAGQEVRPRVFGQVPPPAVPSITDWIAPGSETLPTSRRTCFTTYPHTIDDRE